VSKLITNESGLADTQIGTPYHASPEVWENTKYDSNTDIWSLGVVAYELASLKMPFPAKTVNELYTKISKGKY
jgi:NIMA (never in mitosis gene a)-related kinase